MQHFFALFNIIIMFISSHRILGLRRVLKLRGGGYSNEVASTHDKNTFHKRLLWKPPGTGHAPFSTSSKLYPIDRLKEQYKSRFVHCKDVGVHNDVDVYLCGTLHVAKTSVDFVKDAVRTIKPDFVILEICNARVESLCDPLPGEEDFQVTLKDVFRVSFEDRSLKSFGMGVLTWIQSKAAKSIGSKLGGELAMAAREAHKLGLGTNVVLGDRLFAVTVQRAFDNLSLFERFKMVIILFWEIISMSVFKLKDYLKKSENDEDFIKREIAKFGRYLPGFAQVIINERDEYLSQSVIEVVKGGFSRERTDNGKGPLPTGRRGKVLAVVGAGHLPGMTQHIHNGGVGEKRMLDISCSSKHRQSCWPGSSRFQVVNTKVLFDLPPSISETDTRAETKIEAVNANDNSDNDISNGANIGTTK